MNNGARVTNVLFTCAGRRTFAIRAFQQALNNCGRVFACDASPDAPALQIADKGFVVPPADADNYLDMLLTICREQRVRLLIPAVEPELPLLAAHRARFLEIGTLPLVSSPEIIAICYDKLETATFLERCGLAAPRTMFNSMLRGKLFRVASSLSRSWSNRAGGSARSGLHSPRTIKNSTSLLRWRKNRLPIRFSLRLASPLPAAAF
jgi:carbamoylphosphate synthase large subunit